jgi:hypothetical protein
MKLVQWKSVKAAAAASAAVVQMIVVETVVDAAMIAVDSAAVTVEAVGNLK